MKPDHKRIWLQPGAGDCGETTWCQDRIHDDDIEYIRTDIHKAALLTARQEGRKEAWPLLERLQSWIEDEVGAEMPFTAEQEAEFERIRAAAQETAQ